MLLLRALHHIESAALVMSVVSSPPATSSSSNPMSNNTNNQAPTQADVNNLLGQGIITINDRMGSIEQLLSSLNAASMQQSAPQHVNGVCDDASTNFNPSVIDSIALLLASSGRQSDFRIGRG